MASVQLRRYEQILSRSIGRLVAKTGFSDVADSSVIKNLLAAVAREQDEAYYQMARLRDLFDLRTVAGEDLDERAAEIAPHKLSREAMSYAVGAVRFYRQETAGAVKVPAGTAVKTQGGLVFYTQSAVVLPDGQGESVDVSITCGSAGAAGNVAAGAICRFSEKPPGINRVQNPLGTNQGRDTETDDRFRQRIMLYLASLSRCTTQAMQFAALSVKDEDSGRSVEFASVFEDPIDRGRVILYIDDGTGSAAQNGPARTETLIDSALGGEEYLSLEAVPLNLDEPLSLQSSTRGGLVLGDSYFINPASGRVFFSPALSLGEQVTATYTPFVGLIAAVQRVIDGDPKDRSNYPGYRAAGTLVQVLTPTVVDVQVEGQLTVDSTDRESVLKSAKQAVLQYINGCGISGDVIRSEIIEQIMRTSGVTDVKLSLPEDNVVVLDDQIPRIRNTDLINLS